MGPLHQPRATGSPTGSRKDDCGRPGFASDDDPHRRARPTQRVATRTVAAIVGAAAALLIFAAGIDPWHWWADYRGRAEAPSTHRAVRTGPQGPSAAVQPQPVGTDSSVSKSPRPLILTAIRRGRNAREGYVDIGVNTSSPQTYRAGAILVNGARIEEIHTDYIVLERDGQRARLYVEGHRLVDDPNPNQSLLFVGGADPSLPAIADSRDALTNFIRVTPVYQGDSVRAIEVYANDRSNVFSALGFEPGDRITSINGEPVSDAARAIATLRRLTQGEAMQVTVERRGVVQALSLDALAVTDVRSASTR